MSGTSLGSSSHICSQPTGGILGGGTRKLCSGTGRWRWNGDVQIDLVELIGRPAQLDRDQHGMGTAEDAQGHFECYCSCGKYY